MAVIAPFGQASTSLALALPSECPSAPPRIACLLALAPAISCTGSSRRMDTKGARRELVRERAAMRKELCVANET